MERKSIRMSSDSKDLVYNDLFDLDKMQKLQDQFANSFNIASLITDPDGTPITKPSNFCTLCSNIIRNTEKGQRNCKKSDSIIGKYSIDGPVVKKCLSAGLWDAGAGIAVGGKHIANWLIGQVRDEDVSEDVMRGYAREIGADEDIFIEEFNKIPVMSKQKFEQIAETLYVLANQLSTEAYQNFQKAKLIENLDAVNKEMELKNEKLQQSEEELRVSNEELQTTEEELKSINEELWAANKDLTSMADRLFESEQKYKALSNLTQEGIVIHNKGIILDCNRAFHEMLGYSYEELIGANGVDLFFCAESKKIVMDNIAKENTEPYRVLAERKDGSSISIKIESRNGMYKDQNVRITSFIDMTDEIKQDLLLQESREKYKTVADFTYDWEYWALPDKTLEYISPSCERITGYTREEFILCPGLLSNIVFEEDRAVWEEHWDKVCKENGKVEKVIFRLKAKDGAVKWIEHTCQPVYNAKGEFYGRRASNRDITAMKEVEFSLKEQESNQRALIAGIPDIIMRLDNKGRYLFVSINIEDILGISYKEFIGRTLSEIAIPKDICNLLDDKISEVFVDKKAVETELVISRPKGQIILNVRFVPESFLEGLVNTVIIVARDITEYRKAQAQYKTLFNEMLDGFALHEIICDDTGKPIDYSFIEVNPAFEKMTGLSREDVLGKRVLEIMPSTESVWIDVYGKVALTGEPITFENYSQEIAKYFNVTAFSPSKNRFACIFNDVTARKMAEDALKNSENRLRKYFDMGLVGMAMMSSARRWIDFNSSFCEMLGYTKEEFKKLNWAQITYPEDLAEDSKRFSEISKGMIDSYSVEKRFVNKKGSIIYADISVNIIRGERNDSDYFVILINNITSRKEVEVELQKKNEEYESLNEELMQTNAELVLSKEKAEQSDILKTAFLANMSHEIRTPMNGILGFANLLKDPDISGEEKDNFVDLIELSGKRMLSLISDLVDISKIEAGHMELDLHNFSVNDLIDELVCFFKPEASIRSIELLSKKGLSDKESFLKADKNRLSQVLTNFLANAFKFTSKGQIVLGYEQKGDFLEFYVSDTGIGIPSDMLEIVFERFSQADNSYSRKHEGSGLGLSISKGLVEMHGGKIWAVSEVGEGSCFYCTLPYKQIESSETSWSTKAKEVDFSFDQGRKILVAEDDDVCFALLFHIFTKEGLTIIRARDGKEAVELATAQNDINMILMDIKMPNMNGMEASKIIKKAKPHIPIIAQTAFANTDDKEKILAVGCDDCIFKPVDRKVLLDIVFKYCKDI